ncbi:hypothetical protein MPH_08761 [Macrophomina phaseolina MS6]|uniref:Mg2+ transporter protein CorA-like/Zinc transport protein ZntB n=1 Tax=Macrophomina phaseolina (strain MS6) TaxID=1126212 RepID=K2RV27_MACPH|nr:hypothetical protein MPH_08761 [Macrophomina phaseolina MS6]
MEDNSRVVKALAGAKPHLEFVRDRWPRFSFDASAFTLVVQYFIHNGTVFQQHVFEQKPDHEHVQVVPDLMIDTDVLIRHLDFTNARDKFNEARNHSPEAYATSFGPYAYSLILHRYGLPQKDLSSIALPGTEMLERQGGLDAASFVLALFVNGAAQKIEEVQNKWYKIQNRNQAEAEYIKSGRIEITMAFRLQVTTKDSLWKSSLVPAKELFENREATANSNNPPAAALTCGDFSGHRLVTAASFYAFQFLLSVYQRLEDFGNETGRHSSRVAACSCSLSHGICESRDYIVHVLERIQTTCKGHLKWVFENAERQNGTFGTHYWATGKLISETVSGLKLSAKMLSDTPFQIIKAADYYKTFKDDTFNRHVQTCIKPWLEYLNRLDARKCFVFPRPTSAFTGEYRLDDHVWIWKALSSLEDLGFGAELRPQTRKAANTRERTGRHRKEAGKDGPARDFSSSEIQRHILRRFTTDNPISGQRMLAVSRSSSESRFLFFSRDTAMLHDMNSSFFDVLEAREKVIAWENTLDAQKYHEENQDSGWDNPLRYALALMIGKQGLEMNQRTADGMCLVALHVLLRSSFPSGLFAGQLNEATKEPEMVQEKRSWDFYWHAAFEIPYILLAYGENKTSVSNRPRTVIGHLEPFAFETRSVAGSLMSPEVNYSRRHGFIMKKTMPFNDFSDHKSIVEPSDEWLYNYPEFLDFTPNLDQFQSFEVNQNFNLYDLLRSLSLDNELWDEIRALDPTRYRIARWLSELGYETWDLIRHCHECGGKFLETGETRGTVLDVSRCGFRHAHLGHDKDPGRDVTMMGMEQLRSALDQIRTAESAKKRLVWLPRVNEGSTILCCLASPGSEKAKMSSFFDRHAKAEKFFLDDVNSVLNTWETEFHLSFYHLVDRVDDGDANGMLSFGAEGFPGRGKKIDRAAMGFRFIGDFFDRYWTCHFLERKPGDAVNNEQLEARLRDIIFDKRLPKADRDKPLWRQRKVLELLLFDKILEDMAECVHVMLDAAKTKVQLDLGVCKDSELAMARIRPDMLSDALTDSISLFRIDSDAYLSFREEWAMLERILQVLEEDLGENLEKIGSWTGRDKDRGPEKPRWTKNDERKYRSAITKLQVSNQQRIQELERCQARIRSFSTSLTDRLDRVRDDLNLRGAEDIRLFTYITAFFLPLGFAVSIFSMSDPPHWVPIIGTIGVAIVTLFITVIALINARQLELGFKAAINLFRRSTDGEDVGRRTSVASRRPSEPTGLGIVAQNKEAKRNSASTSDKKMENGINKGRISSFLAHRPGIRRARPLRSAQSPV